MKNIILIGIGIFIFLSTAFSQIKKTNSFQSSKVDSLNTKNSIYLDIEVYKIEYPTEKNIDGSMDKSMELAVARKYFSKHDVIYTNANIRTLVVKILNAKMDSTYTLRLKKFPKIEASGIILYKSNKWKNGEIVIDKKYFSSSGLYEIEVVQDGIYPADDISNENSYSAGQFAFRVQNPG